MNKSEEYKSLVAFTALAPLAVGGLVGLLTINHPFPKERIDWAAAIVLLASVLALGLSLLHLGRPWRAPLALFNPTTSWLSREVILFGLFILVLGIYTFLPFVSQSNPTRSIVGFLGAVIGLAGTIATGEVYRLQSRPSWDHWLGVISFPLGALSAGSLFGYFLGYLLGGRLETSAYAWTVTTIFLVACLTVTLLRTIGYQQGSPELKQSRRLAMGTYLWSLGIRGLGVISALLLIMSGGEIMYFAWIPALIGEIADRYLFFKTVVPVTLRGRYI